MRESPITTGTRINQWWKPKAANLLALLYLAQTQADLDFYEVVKIFVLSVITIAGIGSFGHYVNDLFDREADAKAGKLNSMNQRLPWQRAALIIGSLLIALLPWIELPSNRVSFLLLGAEFLLLLAYAIPPLRWKDQPILAIAADAAYAFALPACLAWYTYTLALSINPNWWLFACLFSWQLLLGARHYLNHLANDRENDLLTGTRTLATIKGNRFISRLIRFVLLPAELVLLLSFAIILGGSNWLIPVCAVVAFFAYCLIPIALALRLRYSPFTYRFTNNSIDGFYQDVWPLIPLVLLTINDWRFSIMLLIHLLLFHALWLRGKSIIPYARTLLYLPLLPFVVLFVSRKKKPAAVQLPLRKSSTGIAVININKNKYTETFINGMVSRLKYRVHYLFGGELPNQDAEGNWLLTGWSGFHALTRFTEALFQLEKDYFLKKSISSYLQSRNIRLVLAEFGTVGTKIYPITKSTGIPLIVWFHGYDVYHQSILNEQRPHYPALFREAKKIIGVSTQMLQVLRDWGAPEEKLVHLPAFVNLELFPYKDRKAVPPAFLAVGRFSETKSPHITILAFSRVVEKIPLATLTMIGQGGGGELFEACMILVRALKLENAVRLLGVLSHTEVSEQMQAARVFVQHSLESPLHHDREGKPVAIMEAMASGMPVVTTNHSGITELIDDGVTGILVAEYDIDAMAAAMLKLAVDDELVSQIGRSASERIYGDPLVKDHIARLESLIDETIEANG